MSLESSDGNVDADVSESKEPNTVGTNVNLDSEQIGEQKYAAQKIRNAVDLNDLASQPPAVQSNFDHQFASSHRVYVKVMHPYEPRRSDEITLRLGDQIQNNNRPQFRKLSWRNDCENFACSQVSASRLN
ncbi:unnamed protein product [Calicophoron daubneyi]|uniref:Uncharacterized protein n=1 Tax=Calicophoron daubneyi TaxID=300641 RepID=A0AAV2T9W2_CALDB